VDFDGDGQQDVLSGSWPGELFLFRGTAGGSFAAPEMVKDKDGQIINIGGGIEERRDEEGILVRGSAEWETVDGKTFVTYRGKRYESTPERPIATTGTASVVRPADWDGDGDLDLIVGDISGNVHLIPNEGTPKSYAFGKDKPLQAGGRPLRVRSRTGPCVADWDSDGDLDLLVGADDGSVSLYRNTGSAKSPELAAAEPLVPPGAKAVTARASKQASRGTRSKVCVADWNADGRLDLLVGDFAYQKPDRPEPTPEEQARYDRIRKELEPIQERYGELFTKLHMPPRVRDKDEREKLMKEWEEVGKQMRTLRSQLPREYELHGWVWLFLRK
jgi:hypothetical protein